MNRRRPAATVGLALLLVACGQSGPGPTPAPFGSPRVVTPPQADAATPAAASAASSPTVDAATAAVTPEGLSTGEPRATAAPPPSAPGPVAPYTRIGTVASGGGSGWLDAAGHLSSARAIEVELDLEPRWISGVALTDGSTAWFVSSEAGRGMLFRLSADGAITESAERATIGLPVLVAGEGAGYALLEPPEWASPLTFPVPLSDGSLVFVDRDGRLIFRDPGGGEAVLAENLLPDARLVEGRNGLLVALGDATGRYAHGVLGDAVEGGAIVVAGRGGWEAQTIPIPAPAVIEAIAPLLADLDGDGVDEIIVTESDPAGGSRIVAYSAQGERWSGEPIGQGSRWRHALAAAPFARDGVTEIAVVRTPHIGGVVEFYRLVDGHLQIAASLPGYSSHRIGSRNLDMAAAADLDGDGRAELLVPTQSMDALAVLGRSANGVLEELRLPLGPRLTTNLALIPFDDGSFALAAGTAGSTLRIWLP